MLDDSFIDELLKKDTEPKYPIVVQDGPLRRFDREMQCLSVATSRTGKNCRAPTYFKLQGIPTCTMHALLRLNEMLVERDVHG